jgi:3-phosphoshikimate 1-carboxyvinyltransferase
VNAVISPGELVGTLTAPPSKSAMQRACALALLNPGVTTILNPGTSNDDKIALNIIHALGAGVSENKTGYEITGVKTIAGSVIHCGESGLSLRMFAPIAALSNNSITLTGEGSLLKRPLHFFADVFPKFGVMVETNDGFLPVRIKGPLLASGMTVDGSSSSQYLTGILFAFAKIATKPVTITVTGLVSKPYVELSVSMLNYFGFNVTHENYERFLIKPVVQALRNITYPVEGDWSSAAFLLVAGAIAGDIKIQGLDIYSAQADLAIIDVLQQAGANIHVEGSCVVVKNTNSLKGFRFDATDCPDLFPPLAALASCCAGESVITGTSRLETKESNRAKTIQDVFSRLGSEVQLRGNEMIIRNQTGILSATVSSHGDHRIAMAAAVAALRANGPVTINHAEAVNKSYPGFFRDMQKLGSSISLH